ncbi:MAG: hypothetical protein ACI4D9_09885 [Lachnospiraceae bacterium]
MRYYKKGILKTLMCIGVGISMIFLSCANVYAANSIEEEEVIPATIDVENTVSLSISSGIATASCKVYGVAGEVTKISISMYLQKKSSDSYVTVCTWVGSKESNYFNFKKTQSISKGTYRVKAKITCYTGSTSETTTRYSTAKTY